MFTYMSCQHCRLNNFKVVGKDSLNIKYDVSTLSSLDIWSYTASNAYGSGIIEYNLYFK